MSLLSKTIKNPKSIVKTIAGGVTGAGLGPIVSALSSGRDRQKYAGAPDFIMEDATDPRAKDILRAIRYAPNRDHLTAANDQLNVLKKEFDSGKINVEQYMATLKDVVPSVTSYIEKGGFGQDPNNVGASNFLKNFKQENDVQNQAFKLFGRYLNSSEFASIRPSFLGPDGDINGNAALAQLAQSYKFNPSLDPYSRLNTTKPEEFNNQINQTFQSILGRAATSNELAHFQDQFKKGALDSFGLESVIKQSPEFTNTQDKQFRDSLNQNLSDYDAYAFNRMGAPNLFSKYAQNGMPAGTSPSLEYAMTDLMGQMAKNRSNYLAQLSAQQYGNNKSLANQNYQSTTDQLLQNWSSNLNRSQQLQDYLGNRGFEGSDYQTQRNDYMKYLNSMKPADRNTPYGQLIASLVGGVGGTLMGAGPAGGLLGAQIGNTAGSLFDYLNV